MPLPIPDIMENAANVLRAAKDVCNQIEFGDESIPCGFGPLRDALKKVSPDDLMAVLNEVGKVYVGIHNVQVSNLGARANDKTKGVDFAIIAEFGLGKREIVVNLPMESAEGLAASLNGAIADAKGLKTGLITNLSGA